LYNEFNIPKGNSIKQALNNLHAVVVKNDESDLNASGGREMNKTLVLGLLVILPVFMAACGPGSSVQVTTPDTTMQLRAPGPNPLINQPDQVGLVARAGAGLWHGIIAPVTLVLSFFNSDIHMYEVHNAGSEYDLGFLLGVALVISLLSLFVRWRRA
jgi:hypothetical protein